MDPRFAPGKIILNAESSAPGLRFVRGGGTPKAYHPYLGRHSTQIKVRSPSVTRLATVGTVFRFSSTRVSAVLRGPELPTIDLRIRSFRWAASDRGA